MVLVLHGATDSCSGPKLEGQTTFQVLLKRWIVERTFSWLMRYRRLRADYETETSRSRA